MKAFKQFLALMLTFALLFGICGVAEDTEAIPAQIEEILEPVEEEQIAAPVEEAPIEEIPVEEAPAEEEPAEQPAETLVEEPEAEESYESEQLNVDPCPEDEHVWDWENPVWKDNTFHTVTCTVCGAQQSTDHSAWCTSPNVCYECGGERDNEYGDQIHHNAGNKYESIDASQHRVICVACDAVLYTENHELVNGVCTLCGYDSNASSELCPDGEHDFDYDHPVPVDEDNHAYKCKICGYVDLSYQLSHTVSCTDKTTCIECGGTAGPNSDLNHPREFESGKTFTYKDDTCHVWTCPDCGAEVEYDHVVPCSQTAPYTCTDCNHEVKNPELLHQFDWDSYKSDDTYHWNYCTVCGAEDEKEEHWSLCDKPGVCVVCGTKYSGANVDHQYDYDHPQHDATSHWFVCDLCGAESEHEPHWAFCDHPGVCAECEATACVIADIFHDESYYSGAIVGSDSDQHWRKCAYCGELNYEMHTVQCDDKSGKCECGKSATEVYHDSSYYSGPIIGTDANRHWRMCDICGTLNYEEHAVSCDDADGLCECGRPATVVYHNYDWEDYEYDEKSHWHICKTCGKKENHDGHVIRCVDSNARTATCLECGAEVIPSNAYVTCGNYVFKKKDNKYHVATCGWCGSKIRVRHSVSCTSKTPKVCEICGAKKCSAVKYHDGDFLTTVTNEKQCGSYCSNCKKNVNMQDHYVTCDSEGRCVYCNKLLPEATVKHSYMNGVCIFCGSGIAIEYPKTLTMTVKESRTPKPITPDDGFFTYKSSNPSVVSVDKKKGKITAKAVGEADITVTGKSSKQKATCHVTVKPSATSLSLNSITATPVIGAGFPQLKATVLPADTVQEVTWKTSNDNVSVTDDGLVLPMKAGKVTITATSKAVNKKGKKLTQKITLTVVDPKLPTGVKIDQATNPPTIYLGGEGIKLSAVVEPVATASQEVTWSIPKKQQKYATIDPNTGMVKPGTKAGTVTVTVTTKEKKANGKKATATIKIIVAKAP